MRPISIRSFTAVNALGNGLAEINQAMLSEQTGLHRCDFPNANLDACIGSVKGLDAVQMPDGFEEFECRNNRIALLGLMQDDFIKQVNAVTGKYANTRVAVIIGTSTSGVESLEQAYRDRDPQTDKLPDRYKLKSTFNFYSVTDFVKQYFKLRGPSQTIATACSSSTKVFAAAYRMMAAGLCDAAIVGGVDSLCLNTLYGFDSLQILSSQPCRPCDADRNGISLGEAGGFALLEWKNAAEQGTGVDFIGYGESTDGYHMSSPPPDGAGARLAMEAALKSSELKKSEIDYINMHGTGSLINDVTEDNAITDIFGEGMICTATKGYTGHTLAAAGITESVLSFLSIQNDFIPATANTNNCDPALRISVNLRTHNTEIRHVLSNSFGFGGNNCTLVFRKS